jgi:hypothetical protein
VTDTQTPDPSRQSGRRLAIGLGVFMLLALAAFTFGLYTLRGRPAVPRAPVTLADPDAFPPALAETLGEEGTLRIEVVSLQRLSSGLVELRLAVTHIGTDGTALDIAQRFSADDPDRGTLAEVYLADLAHQRKLFILRDADGVPLGSRDEEPLTPGERRVLWARYPAPLEDEAEVVVHVPHADPMPNVPVGRPADEPEAPGQAAGEPEA